jgi:hypothetical protein
MNLNPLILTNIQNSPYFKTSLSAIKVAISFGRISWDSNN